MLFQTCASIFAASSGCSGTGWCRSWPWPTWGPQLQMRWDQTLFANYVSYCKVPNRIYLVFWGVFCHFLARQITYSAQNLWGQFWPWPTWGPLFATYFSYYYLQSSIETELILSIFGVFWHFLARQITYLVRNLWGQFWPWPTWGPHLQLRWDQTLWRGIGHPWSGIEHRWAFGWSYTRSLVWRVAIVFALFQVSCENTKSKNTVCFIRKACKIHIEPNK